MKDSVENLKVAIVAEELTQLGGAERVLDALMEIFPKAPIFTLVWDPEKTQRKYDKYDVRPSFIQKMPFGIKKYKWYLPLMPLAVESFNFSGFDLVISSSSALIKGIRTNKNQTHICYCHTPTRYLWSDRETYLKTAPIPFFIKPIMPIVTWFLRRWDLKASKRPDYFIANAINIQKKIKKYYGRDSEVIYPPVESEKFGISKNLDEYFLVVARLEPYKMVDMVIEAFKQSDKKLKIIGSGTKKEELMQAAGENIKFAGRVSDEELVKAYAECQAFIFPQEEDFGIVALEAMASGRPVIAYKKGGALETIVEGKTGEFFNPQTAGALKSVLENFDSNNYNPQSIRSHALKFDKEVFKQQILSYIKDKVKNR